jgi:hypothetical protein
MRPGDVMSMSGQPTSAAVTGELVPREMLDEGRRLVEAARAAGVTLRMLGGLAVREHCRTHELCERDYSDLDMVARARQARRLPAVFAGFGFAENYDVRTATAGVQMQFVRPCAHHVGAQAPPAHAEDHVDVFLDTVRMDHDIALARRLELEPYTVSLSDLVISKLQIFRLNEKDVRDVVTLLGDFEVGDQDAPGLINGRYIGELCADDWGLFYDVTSSLRRVDEGAAGYELSDEQLARVRRGVARLIGAIDGAPKSLGWRLRARVGTRKAWHNQLDGQE